MTHAEKPDGSAIPCRIFPWLSIFGGLILSALAALAVMALRAEAEASDAKTTAQQVEAVNVEMHKLEASRWDAVQKALDRIEKRLDKANRE